jgi:NADH-quinone oxidoreductase subunit N
MIFFTDPVNDSVSVVIPTVKSKLSIAVATIASIILGLAPSLLLSSATNFATFIK